MEKWQKWQLIRIQKRSLTELFTHLCRGNKSALHQDTLKTLLCQWRVSASSATLGHLHSSVRMWIWACSNFFPYGKGKSTSYDIKVYGKYGHKHLITVRVSSHQLFDLGYLKTYILELISNIYFSIKKFYCSSSSFPLPN